MALEEAALDRQKKLAHFFTEQNQAKPSIAR
jgi:hypothetical protein